MFKKQGEEIVLRSCPSCRRINAKMGYSFSHLTPSGLAQLITESFIEAPSPKPSRIDPPSNELVTIAQR